MHRDVNLGFKLSVMSAVVQSKYEGCSADISISSCLDSVALGLGTP